MSDQRHPLEKIRADQLFARGVEYVHKSAGGIKRVNSQELGHLNSLLTESPDDPWRSGAADVRIGGGQLHQFSVVSNPVQRARELCGDAVQIAGNGKPVDAALTLYIELVLAHLFKEANRRTAALAALWILEHAGHSVDASELLKVPLGNLRAPDERRAFERSFRLLVEK